MNKLFSNSPGKEVSSWAKEGEESKLAGKFGLGLIMQSFINPETNQSEEYAFCRKAAGVTVVPVLANGNLVITRTFKQGTNQVVWEFPAGRKPKEVAATDQAGAELAEETGLTAGEMIYLGRACVAPRKFDTHEDLFVAVECTMGTPNPGPGEILEVWEMTRDELFEILKKYDGSFSGFSEMALMRAHMEGRL